MSLIFSPLAGFSIATLLLLLLRKRFPVNKMHDAAHPLAAPRARSIRRSGTAWC